MTYPTDFSLKKMIKKKLINLGCAWVGFLGSFGPKLDLKAYFEI